MEGKITTTFGRIRYINGKISGRHSGVDIANKKGTDIISVNSGKVVLSKFLKVTGNTVIVDHGYNIFSSYSHMDKRNVEEGQYIKKSDLIGTVGTTGFSTGPHLHFAILIGNVFVNPESFYTHNILK